MQDRQGGSRGTAPEIEVERADLNLMVGANKLSLIESCGS